MFVSEALKTHLEQSATINLQSLVLAEWNMNVPGNIFKTGNYRYRPTTAGSIYNTIPNTFDSLDIGDYYTGALDSSILIDNGDNNQDIPQQLILPQERLNLLFSLEDCLKPFRPRSGINKSVYIPGRYLANSGADIAQRPRYYMPSRYDQFRYWTSYRTEQNLELGIANNTSNGLYFIDDAAPFVVYKEQVPANRIVLKMQTNVGDVDLGPFPTNAGSINDPLFGNENKTTPVRWKIQYLQNNNWTDAISFSENDIRDDESAIVKTDGYVELQYGLIIPDAYKESFIYAETLSSATLLPSRSIRGYAYLIIENIGDRGTFYIWDGLEYQTFVPEYGWTLGNEDITNTTGFVTDFTSPESFSDNVSGGTTYRQFAYINGIRVVVETMNKFGSTFDLIEMSPRLIANISDKVIEYKTTKVLSDLGNTALPVGQLLASNGQIALFDDDQSFNSNNSNSIISNYLTKNVKFNFYEIIVNVDGFDYYVPIKTLYSEGVPQADITAGTINIGLRDFYFFLESMPAPRLLMTNTSLSMAISTLLDYIGFSNYAFKRLENEDDPIIPYFFVAPDQNVAEVLNQLAVATQSAMFFDEYNNFIVMSKNYIFPNENERPIDFLLLGNNNQIDAGVIKNESSGNIPNILNISSEDKQIVNDGKIVYTTRYIKRTYGSYRQSLLTDKEKTWIYEPSLLWEVAGTEITKTTNAVAETQSSYTLSAVPLNSDLSSVTPIVQNGIVINNIMDLGENVFWISRFQGYFYANGEIIKYDAVEFNITGTGNVWISNNQEYQRYFASLPFNGKIYPTGNVRIYSEPYYETVDGIDRLQPGPVYKHGRGQFGTTINFHNAGLSSYWSSNDFIRGCNMQSQFLFTTKLDSDISYPPTTLGAAGVDKVKALGCTRSGIIKNFMATDYYTDEEFRKFKTTRSGTIQSSALVMTGPSFKTTEKPLNFVSYVYKELIPTSQNFPGFRPEYISPPLASYKTFGTRMRIIGKIDSGENRGQTPVGSIPYYQVTSSGGSGSTNPSQNTNIGGGSGGMGVLINPETNNGYYFEIAALTAENVESYLNLNDQGESSISISNVVFYKVKKKSTGSDAIPIKLWGGLTKIIVDDGRFTGQYRLAGEENPTVYDLMVEYEKIGKGLRFYLYINNKLIKVVDDPDPLPIYNNMSLFVRGSSQCMFENVFALAGNYSKDTSFPVARDLSTVFGDNEIDADESFRKYALSGVIQGTYLTKLGSQSISSYSLYFEEFGTIMRECAYFDIRYDRSYPALYAKISPTFNRIKGYTISGFQANSYGAEFLIFNATDKALSLDETTGNYLRIQGVTFTQDTTYELTVDDYFKNLSNFSDPQLSGSTLITSPLVEKKQYDQVKVSRMNYGKNEFSLDSVYIQTQDDAEKLMGWIIDKVMVPKKSIGVQIFALPTLQLGDIVNVEYQDSNGLDLVAPSSSKFLIYNIEYRRSLEGPEMTLYLSEV